ncbi:MAG: hypothetical protein KY468_02000 [Armatimonadetes bacterium]|nr:hypothetical protein [Armatimonadota bacterium]
MTNAFPPFDPSPASRADSSRSDLLQEAVIRNRKAYARMLRGGPCWDRLILTASHQAQADGYAEEIALRRTAGLLPPRIEVEILPDPPGGKVGSGGATFNVLRQAGVREGERALLLHCGGESRRLPAYGPLGKLFAPLPCPRSDGRASTVFDEILVSLSPVAARMAPGWLIAAADLLLLFRSTRLTPPAEAVMGLGFAIDAKTAQGHGVYVPGRGGAVKRFMQKPSTGDLLEAGALSADGTAIADTGVFTYPEAVLHRLLACSRERWSEIPSDIYEDWVLPMVPSQTHEAFLSKGDPKVRRPLWDALRDVPLRLRVADPSQFVHLGSTAQWRDGLLFDRLTASALGFEPVFRSYVHLDASPGEACILNSVVSDRPGIAEGLTGKELAPLEPVEDASSDPFLPLPDEAELLPSPVAVVEPGAVVEACRLHGNIRIRSGAAAVGVQARAADLDLPSGYTLDQLPVTLDDGREGWVTRLYPIGMDPKATGEGVRLFNAPAMEWLKEHGLALNDLWDEGVTEESVCLWNARLFPAAETPEASLNRARWLLDCARIAAGIQDDLPSPERRALARADWFAAPRISFEACSTRADRRREREARLALEHEAVIAQVRRTMERDEDARQLFTSPADFEQIEEALTEEITGGKGPLRAARAHWIVVDVLKTLHRRPTAVSGPMAERMARVKAAAHHHEAAAFTDICRAVDLGAPAPVHDPRLRLSPDQEVFADAPVRLDFAGAWLDTPPYSLEHGGAVLNVALLLDGHRPVRAWVRPLPSPVLRFGSKDLGQSVTLTRLSEALAYQNPRDPFALHKAAVALMGIVTAEGGPLSRQMERFGGGLELVTESAVPKGSGLGTSSILGGVALAALGKAVGVELGALELFDLVLALEQRMTTGGGWQDQIGGLMGGWKVTRTHPGIRQVPQVEPFRLTPEAEAALRERTILMYSGYARLAKNILRSMVGQYLSKDGPTMGALCELQDVVEKTTDALRAGEMEALGAALDRSIRADVAMDPQSWPPHIASIVDAVRPHLYGAKPTGAGGGGFLLMLARSPEDRKRAVEALSRLDLPPAARVYPLEISQEGLRVTVNGADS